jgi:hypothetical protein
MAFSVFKPIQKQLVIESCSTLKEYIIKFKFERKKKYESGFTSYRGWSCRTIFCDSGC